MSVAHNLEDKLRTKDIHIKDSIDFSGLLLSQPVLEGLIKAGFKRPSPIQLKAIPLGRCGLDLIVQAKSGTGKTCVFAVIALEGIDIRSNSAQVLILAPTREIAIQIAGVIEKLGSSVHGLKVLAFIGGTMVSEDKKRAKQCHIVVGTPGRIKQLIEIGILKTNSLRLLVLDEADTLLDGDFTESINWIYSSLPENKQMLALSATYPEYLANYLTRYMRNPTFIRLNVSDPALIGIKQFKFIVPSHPLPNKVFEFKTEMVIKILSTVDFQQCLVFSNQQYSAQHLQTVLESHNWPTVCIAGCLDQKDRNFAMEQLKTYQCRVLISTDLTSRGIDADKVDMVINLDVPRDHETYLHRIGRAGRFGSYGAAISIISKGGQEYQLNAVEKACNTHIPYLPSPIPIDLATKTIAVKLSDVVSTKTIITEPKSDKSVNGSNSVEIFNVESLQSRNGSEEATPKTHYKSKHDTQSDSDTHQDNKRFMKAPNISVAQTPDFAYVDHNAQHRSTNQLGHNNRKSDEEMAANNSFSDRKDTIAEPFSNSPEEKCPFPNLSEMGASEKEMNVSECLLSRTNSTKEVVSNSCVYDPRSELDSKSKNLVNKIEDTVGKMGQKEMGDKMVHGFEENKNKNQIVLEEVSMNSTNAAKYVEKSIPHSLKNLCICHMQGHERIISKGDIKGRNRSDIEKNFCDDLTIDSMQEVVNPVLMHKTGSILPRTTLAKGLYDSCICKDEYSKLIEVKGQMIACLLKAEKDREQLKTPTNACKGDSLSKVLEEQSSSDSGLPITATTDVEQVPQRDGADGEETVLNLTKGTKSERSEDQVVLSIKDESDLNVRQLSAQNNSNGGDYLEIPSQSPKKYGRACTDDYQFENSLENQGNEATDDQSSHLNNREASFRPSSETIACQQMLPNNNICEHILSDKIQDSTSTCDLSDEIQDNIRNLSGKIQDDAHNPLGGIQDGIPYQKRISLHTSSSEGNTRDHEGKSLDLPEPHIQKNRERKKKASAHRNNKNKSKAFTQTVNEKHKDTQPPPVFESTESDVISSVQSESQITRVRETATKWCHKSRHLQEYVYKKERVDKGGRDENREYTQPREYDDSLLHRNEDYTADCGRPELLQHTSVSSISSSQAKHLRAREDYVSSSSLDSTEEDAQYPSSFPFRPSRESRHRPETQWTYLHDEKQSGKVRVPLHQPCSSAPPNYHHSHFHPASAACYHHQAAPMFNFHPQGMMHPSYWPWSYWYQQHQACGGYCWSHPSRFNGNDSDYSQYIHHMTKAYAKLIKKYSVGR